MFSWRTFPGLSSCKDRSRRRWPYQLGNCKCTRTWGMSSFCILHLPFWLSSISRWYWSNLEPILRSPILPPCMKSRQSSFHLRTESKIWSRIKSWLRSWGCWTCRFPPGGTRWWNWTTGCCLWSWCRSGWSGHTRTAFSASRCVYFHGDEQIAGFVVGTESDCLDVGEAAVLGKWFLCIALIFRVLDLWKNLIDVFTVLNLRAEQLLSGHEQPRQELVGFIFYLMLEVVLIIEFQIDYLVG